MFDILYHVYSVSTTKVKRSRVMVKLVYEILAELSLSCGSVIKGIVHPEMKTHPHIFPNSYGFLSSAEHQRRTFCYFPVCHCESALKQFLLCKVL